MTQKTTGIYKAVTVPTAYRLLMWALGSHRALTQYAVVLDAGPRTRMLDVGCGPATILDYLHDDVNYTGIDLNEPHIDFARTKYGNRGRFIVGNADSLAPMEPGSFDLITLFGLLHHLSDDAASSLLQSVRDLLTVNGRIVSVDTVWLTQQRKTALLLNSIDSGKNIRRPEEYLSLYSKNGFNANGTIRNDLLRIPYDHFFVTATI